MIDGEAELLEESCPTIRIALPTARPRFSQCGLRQTNNRDSRAAIAKGHAGHRRQHIEATSASSWSRVTRIPRSMPDDSAPSNASLLGKSWRRVRRVPALGLLKAGRYNDIADIGHPLIELGKDQPRGRIDLEVSPRKHLRIFWVPSEHEAIGSTYAHVLLALEKRHAQRLRRPPPFQELRSCPCIKDDMRRRIEHAGDSEFPVARALYDRFVFRGALKGRCLPHPTALSA